MMRACMLLTLIALTVGCAGQTVKVDQAQLIGAVAQGAACVQSVQTTALNPVCQAPVVPCQAAYEAGRSLVTGQ